MKILIATDGTKHSDSAIEMITNFSLKQDDKVKLVSVVDMAMPLAIDIYSGYLPNSAEIEDAAREHAKETLEKTKTVIQEKVNNSEVIIETETLIGSPESRIVECAEEMNADLIIVGSHGYNRWERLLLGSVSDSVIHHAPCSVLVVRSETE